MGEQLSFSLIRGLLRRRSPNRSSSAGPPDEEFSGRDDRQVSSVRWSEITAVRMSKRKLARKTDIDNGALGQGIGELISPVALFFYELLTIDLFSFILHTLDPILSFWGLITSEDDW